MSRVYNFSAGPSVLPEEVLKAAGDEMLDWHSQRHVCYGNEPSVKMVRRDHQEC